MSSTSATLRVALGTLALGVAGLPTMATANPARVQALGSNPAFIDDTEVLIFPSYIEDADSGATISYNAAGGADVAANLDGNSLVWIGRGVPASLAGEVGGSPWQVVYGMDDGDTGKLFRSSWEEGVFSLGGAWSRGDYSRNGESLSVSGDLRAFGALDGEGPDTEFAVDLETRSRTLTEAAVKGWTARLSHATTTENTYAGALYTVGPRLSSGDLRAALVAEPGLFIVQGKNDTSLLLQAPRVLLSGEASLTDWMVIRGAAGARWLLNVADVSDFTKTDSWSTSQTATLGMGFKKDDLGRLDVAMNPMLLVNGPHVLSGVSTPAFLTVSAQAFY